MANARRNERTLRHRRVKTKLFEALFAFSPEGLCYLSLAGDREGLEDWRDRNEPDAALVADRSLEPKFVEALQAYARGDEVEFDVPLDLRGTPFQLGVWRELRRIPRGRTRTYAEIARRIGKPTAMRAVGGANSHNPVPLVVPCHRVVAVSGLGGFTFGGCLGGLEVKRALLELEGALEPEA